MKKVICEAVNGFASDEADILLIDGVGRDVYHFYNPNNDRITFNMPAGVWYTENRITLLKRPLRYIYPEYAPADKDTPIVDLKFIVKRNPNKCSIDVSTGKVIIDYEIAGKEIPFYNYILFHECGHFYYHGGPWQQELKCDIFAAGNMLDFGFNPSQITYAQELCLDGGGESSEKRKNGLYEWLLKVECYE